MTKLLRDEADPLSLVLAPAHLPMYNFKHVCFDYDYAMNFTKIEGVWPWSTMKSLKLVDYYAPTPKIVADDCEFVWESHYYYTPFLMTA